MALRASWRFAVRFTEAFGVRWYGLAYALGFLFGYLALRVLGDRDALPMWMRP